MTTVRVVCVNAACQKVLRVRASQGGKQIRCPVCQTAMMAPTLAEAAAAGLGVDDAGDAALTNRPPAWMTALFYFGMFACFLGVLLAVAGFEIYLALDAIPVNKGPTAKLLAGTTWKINKVEGKHRQESAIPAVWCEKGFVWTFHDGDKAETGRLLEGGNRYERQPSAGFRTWQWKTSDDQLTMTCQGEKPMSFVVAQRPKELLAFSTTEDDGGSALVLAKVETVDTFPDLRVVFYGGVLAPTLVTFLLAWLISREVFYNGCLRFLLGWPLTVFLGLALGAATGFLMDVLDDHSHIAEPYWMMLGLLQGMIGVATGLMLSILSCLRPA